ncbi:MAG: hypothetical protein EBT92_02525 [Planctomycetes bacterium]|nr:hypothetical protein [Planctomycetota bacterium]
MNINESNSSSNKVISNSVMSSYSTDNPGKIMILSRMEKTISNSSWFKRLGFASSLSLAILGIPTIAEAAVGTSILPAITWLTPGIPNKASIALNQAIETHRRGDYEEADKCFKEVESRQKDLLPAEVDDFKKLYEANKKALKARKESTSTLDIAEDLVGKKQFSAANDLTKKIAFDEQYLRESDKLRFKNLQESIKNKNLTASPDIQIEPKELKISEPKSIQSVKLPESNSSTITADQVRALMAQGDLEKAEVMLAEVATSGVPEPDTQAKLKAELQKLKQDPKALLVLARKKFTNKEFDRAEFLAKAAEKSAYTWTFALSSDSPSKLLKEIQGAKLKADAALLDSKSLTKENAIKSESTITPKALNSEESKATSQTVKSEASVGSTEAARTLIRDARKALTEGNSEKAKKLNEQAKSMKPTLNWWEDNPERVQSDILRSEGKTSTEQAGKDTPKETEDPRQLLRRGRKMLAENKTDEATRLMLRAKAAPGAKWGLFEDTPDKLRAEIEKLQAKKDKEESVKVLLEARKLFEQEDFEAATKAAYRAQQLHGPYNVWDTSDRPQRLIAEIETSKLKAKKNGVTAKKDTPKDEANANDPATLAKAQAYLKEARIALESGNPEKAAGLAFMVKGMKVKSESLGGDTPDALLKDIEKNRVKTVADKTTPAETKISAPAITSNPLITPTVVTAPVIPPAPPTPENDKAKTIALLMEARQLQLAGNLVGARMKAIEAQKQGIIFQPNEDSPEQLLLQLSSSARNQIDDLVTQATRSMNSTENNDKKEEIANQALDNAISLSKSFGQDIASIEAKKLQLGLVKTKVPGSATITSESMLESNQGKMMLEKSRLELRSGQLVAARKLAVEAYQGAYGVKEEAASVLRSIDIEDVNQKMLETRRAFDAALSAYNRKDYEQSKIMISTLTEKNLDKERQQKLKEILMTAEMQPKEKSALSLVKGTSETQTKPAPANNSNTTVKPKEEGEIDLLEATNQLREVKFGQMRQQGLDLQREAMEKFQAGQTEVGIEMLTEYLNELNSNDLDPGKMAFLRRPIESRLQHFKLMKAQKEMLAKDGGQKDKINAIGQKQLADDNKQKKVADLMKQFNQNFKEGKYLEAESYAMRAHELDPDNAMAAAGMSMAKTQRNINVAKKLKSEKETFFLDGLNATDKVGPALEMDKPLDTNPEMADRRNKRKNLTSITSTTRKSDKEKEIDSKLSMPVNLNFNNILLKDAIEDLRSFYGINIVPDMPALEQEGISLDRPVSLKLEQVSLKSALNLLLHSVHLTYVIKDEVLQITTESHARGKLQTVTYQVADLVVPVENYVNPLLTNSLSPILGISANQQSSNSSATTPLMNPNSMTGGTPTGTPSGTVTNGNVSTTKKSSQTMEEMLIKLLTSTISPQAWNNMGGPGTIEYFPLTMSLVINQSPDIQEQVADLLTALRRLQDQEVAVEIRFISIAEDFYERIGVDFNLNIKTDRNTQRFEPQIQSGQYKPSGFINDPNFDRMIAGITPSGNFTSDLDIPIKQTSYPLAMPSFGGYPGLPGAGGLAMGLAFLSDIQVFLFMEAVQGDRRTNVMQAPKLTMFNGQNANIIVAENQFFVTGVNVSTLINGNITFAPQVQAFPFGVYMNVQPLISADRRTVRLNIPVTLTNLVPGPVSLFPVVVPIFPSSSALSTNPGDPITFTQYIQQPVINTIAVQTTVSVPDGGTVLMGGIKRLSESRNEYGPPILSKIPYLNRFFRNNSYGREAESLLIMVTPRIIIQEEEEFYQTGYKAPPNVNP